MSSSSALRDSDRSLAQQSAPDTPIIDPKMTLGTCPRALPKATLEPTLNVYLIGMITVPQRWELLVWWQKGCERSGMDCT